MIKGAVIAIMIFSIPTKAFNAFFQWRENKQSRLLRKNHGSDITSSYSRNGS
jgi:hypothetical protein